MRLLSASSARNVRGVGRNAKRCQLARAKTDVRSCLIKTGVVEPHVIVSRCEKNASMGPRIESFQPFRMHEVERKIAAVMCSK